MNSLPLFSQFKSECKEHTLLTRSQRIKLISFIDQRIKETRISISELNDGDGGSYGSLSRIYLDRKKIYEINHMPPSSCYKTPYNNISTYRMPAILMDYNDHRGYDTTSQGILKNHDFDSKKELRDYMQDEIEDSDFAAALRADLDFLLKKREFVIKYSQACKKMVDYCNTPIEGAPCNPDCPNYIKNR